MASSIQFKTLNQLVQIQLDYIAANAPAQLTVPLGPFITAVAYAVALVGLVLQRLIQLVLAAARLATASGVDVDSYVADFGLVRLGAVPSTGLITFLRFVAGPSTIKIPVGTIVQTAGNPATQFQVVPPSEIKTSTLVGSLVNKLIVIDNSGMRVGDTIDVDGLTFISGSPTILSMPDKNTINLNGNLNIPPLAGTVVTDTTLNPAYDPSSMSYLLLASQTEVDARIQALVAGSGGNVAANLIVKIGSSIAGIDAASNGSDFRNGEDEETDGQLKARFALYILSLSKGTKTAILSAVSQIQQGLIVLIIDPADLGGPGPDGTFEVVVDDGSGTPPASLISAASAAVNATRPIGVRPIVSAPTVLNYDVYTVTVEFDGGITPDALVLQTIIRNAIVTYVNSIIMGEAGDFSQIFRAVWDSASPGDAVNTTILDVSTQASVIIVASTAGMASGQVVDVTGAITASGALPRIVSVDSDTQLTLDVPFIITPVPGTIVTAYSTVQKQILDMHNVNLNNSKQGTTAMATSGVSTSTVLQFTALVGTIANGQLVVVDGLQTDPNGPAAGGPPTVSSFDGTAHTITLDHAIGKLNSDGSWTELAPSPGTLVSTIDANTADLIASDPREASRTSTSRIYVGMVKV